MTRRLTIRKACWTVTSCSMPGTVTERLGGALLDLATGLALCLFFDGTGDLAGFHARIDGKQGADSYHWDGTYGFEENDKRHGDR